MHCSREDLLALAGKWDALGACMLVKASEVRVDEAVGLFAVPKDETYDRLIINPTVINSRQYGYSKYTRTLAPGSLVCMIRLEDHENLVLSSDDLCEFYYTFKVPPARARRNAIGIPYMPHEVSHLQCFDPRAHNEPVYLCLATLAMGDGLAVEIAQQAHYNLLQSLGGCMRAEEVIAYRKVIPRGPFFELLTIDDHIGLQKVDKSRSLESQDTRDKVVFRQANVAYEQVGLTAHPGKRTRQVLHGVVLGAEVDGKVGCASAPRLRVAAVMFVTAIVAHKRRTTHRILQCILGNWVHICLFRRPCFCVLEEIYQEGRHHHPDEVFQLSNRAVNELLMIMILGPWLQTDLRTHVCPDLFVLDASPSGGAICRSTLNAQAVGELWRFSEQRGFYTKLQEGASMVLRELGFEHEEEFGAAGVDLADFRTGEPLVEYLEITESGTVMFDCVELFCSHGTWFDCHREAGLRMCPGMALDYAALEDQATFLELARLASSGAVREWHAGPPCWSFGTFKQPRLRSRDEPAGFEMAEPTTLRHTKLAIRTAFILILAMLSGSFVSCEQPSSSVMFHLHIFQVLRRLGCWVSHFHSCAFGSGFNKPSLWLHNKPWLLRLDGVCRCPSRGRHLISSSKAPSAAGPLRSSSAVVGPHVLKCMAWTPSLVKQSVHFQQGTPLSSAGRWQPVGWPLIRRTHSLVARAVG